MLAVVVVLAATLLLWPAPDVPAPAEAVQPMTAAESTSAAIDASAPVAAIPVQATQAPAAPAEPTPDPKAVNLRKLHEAVFAPFRGVAGRFGIYVKDLGTGQTIALNEHFPFYSASLYKLPVMYEVFKLRDLDLFRLNEEMTIGADDAEMDLGSLPWPIGTRITIGTALDRMVTLSDNSGAYMLAKKVGSPRINEDMLGLGLTHTYIRGDDLKTSAYDMGRLLELIARGQTISPETSAEMVHLMARQQVRNRIPVKMPQEAVVANKTGNLDTNAHDVAIVYGPRATFVIALLSDGSNDLDDLYDAMSTASRNVYDLVNDPTFESRPDPALPKNLVGNYITPVKLPNGVTVSGSSVAQPSTSSSASTSAPRPTTNVAPPAPAPTSPPADRPRAAAPTSPPGVAPTPTPGTGPSIAPKPAAKPAEKPVEKPAEKPAEKPQAPASTPAIKPIGPSIFVIATPTKAP